MAQIVAEGLCKSFTVSERLPGIGGAVRGLFSRRSRQVHAIDDLCFEVEAGELIGYIGPNGAGKSTTIKILSGILVPTSGVCRVDGRVPWLEREAHVANIGVVFGQKTQLWWDLPVIESLELLQRIYRLPLDRYRRSCDELIETMGITALLDTPVRQLSLGQRMRCDLVASLLHEPRLLFLDEPTIGLDVAAKLAVRDFVKRLNRERGTTVIMTTHNMDDIEALCDRIMVIGNGRILTDGTLAALRQMVSGGRRIKVELQEEVPFSDPDAKLLEQSGRVVHLEYDPDRISASALVSRLLNDYAIKDLLIENPPIEEVVAELYRNQDQ